jgi:tetratricopeptide (TPR) repeat protein
VLSIALTLVVSAVAFVLGRAKFGLGSGIFLAIAGAIVTLVVLLRRLRKPVETAMAEVEGHLKARRFERAIDRLAQVRRLAIWQPLLGSQIDEQIGVIHYAALNDPEAARPFLERARSKGVQGWTMLAASHYRRGRTEEALQVLERAARKRPKEGLVWATYAWARLRHGGRAQALDVLASGRKRLPSDDRLKRLQIALQNGKEMHMRTFGTDWYALGLEKVPQPTMTGPNPDHPAFRRRGGGRPRRR